MKNTVSENIHFGTRACKSVESQVSQDLGASTASHPPSPRAGRGPQGDPSPPSCRGRGFLEGPGLGLTALRPAATWDCLLQGWHLDKHLLQQQDRQTTRDCKQLHHGVCAGRSVVSTSLQPVDCGLPGSSVRGISQTQILEWVTMSFSKGSSRPRD